MSLELSGTWKLITFIGKDSEENVHYPFGENPTGYITFTTDKYMFTTITSSNRSMFGSTDRLGASDTKKIKAFDSHISYCSEYSTEENRVLLKVLASSVPDWIGTVQQRYFSFEGDNLILETKPRSIGGRRLRMKVTWEKCR